MIKPVKFADGIKNKRVSKLDTCNGYDLYILKEEKKHLDNDKTYLVNPMFLDEGDCLVFTHNNYQFFKNKVKGVCEMGYSKLNAMYLNDRK